MCECMMFVPHYERNVAEWPSKMKGYHCKCIGMMTEIDMLRPPAFENRR
jgi:hypothetical protein